MNMQKFLRHCALHGRDEVELLTRFVGELSRLRLRNPALYQRIYHEWKDGRETRDGRGLLTEDEAAYFPCRWCNDPNVWGEDWHGWLHWFVCGWPGYGCTSFAEPPPPPAPSPSE